MIRLDGLFVRARVLPLAMVGELITLPLRLSIRTASFFLRGSEEVLKRALALTGRPVAAEPTYGKEQSSDDDIYDGAETTATAERTAPPLEVEVESEPPQAQAPPEPLVEQPTHVSEEVTLVEEFAEPGAEEGAGAQVTIDEPWEDYAKLSAHEVIERLSDATAAELAAVNLYESANHARRTVLSEVERQLQLADRDGASD
jgi:hypothetical protein